MTDTTSSTKKAGRERMPVIGQRVPKDIRDEFNRIAKDNYNTTPANLLRALMEAITKQPGKGRTEPLKVQVSAGVTKDEVSRIVRKELASFFPEGLPKTTNDKPATIPVAQKTIETYSEVAQTTSEELKLAAAFDELWKQSAKVKDGVIYVMASMTADDNGAVMSKVVSDMKLSRQWQKSADPARPSFSTITAPNASVSPEIASEFGKRFKAGWIASRLKK